MTSFFGKAHLQYWIEESLTWWASRSIIVALETPSTLSNKNWNYRFHGKKKRVMKLNEIKLEAWYSHHIFQFWAEHKAYMRTHTQPHPLFTV